MYNFAFSNPVKVEVGCGKYRNIGSMTAGERVMLISDGIIASMPFYSEIKNMLGARFACEYTGVIPNPECENIDEATAIAREYKADSVLGVGGGSVLDAAKVTAMLMTGGGTAKEYVDGSRPVGAGRLPLTLCPTTAGTGSEVTNVAVITNREACKKVPLVGNSLFADMALIDPCLTETMPPKVEASTGFDALCHAIESYWSRVSTPVSDSLALNAIRLIVTNLEKAWGGDGDAKEEMAVASYMAGLAFNQTRTNVCHAISYYLTARYGIDHGTACAITLVPFLRYNYDTVQEKLDMAGRLCGFSDGAELIDRIERLYYTVRMSRSLSTFGIGKDDLPRIADEALQVASHKQNAKEVTRDRLLDILGRLI